MSPNRRMTSDASRREEAMNLAAKALKHRDRFENEIAVLLRNKDLESEVPHVLETFRRWGTLDDRRVAEGVRDQALAKRSSTQAIRAKLLSRGVEADLVEEVLSTLDSSQNLSAAQALVTSKFNETTPAPKIARFLGSRGFSEEVIEAILEGRTSLWS